MTHYQDNLLKQFQGQHFIITGSTQGLGEAIARLFIQRGAAGLVICGRSEEKGEKLRNELSRPECPVHYVQADLSNTADCRKIVEEAKKKFNQIHGLVNSAAMTNRGSLLDASEAYFDQIFAINVKAPFFLMQEVARHMIGQHIAGSMVNISSVCAHGGQPFLTLYSASKSALNTLTKSAAFQLMRNRIRVNGINVGWMNTPGEDRIQREYHQSSENWLEKASQSLPFGRLIQTDEIARLVAYLCSEESGLMTGSLIDFDQYVKGCCEEGVPRPSARLLHR